RMGPDFRWPTSMLECYKDFVFWALTDDVNALKGDEEAALNHLYFFDNLDKGAFDTHKNDWVLIYQQKVIKFGPKLTNQEAGAIEDEFIGSIYMPVDQSQHMKLRPAKIVRAQLKRVSETDENSVLLEYNFRDPKNNKVYDSTLDTGAPETTLPFYVRRQLGKAGWRNIHCYATGYGAPSRVFLASCPFLVSIGDSTNWTKWVQTDTLRVLEMDPGDHVTCSLVGNDVLDQLAYVHEPQNELKFLEEIHEPALATFLTSLA
ncbi:31567_t:CDS:2, partial [Racocetra persica]